MNCPVCLRSYNLKLRRPLVLQCGHTLCKACLQQLRVPLRCPVDRQDDTRPVSELPTNYALVEAAHLEQATALRGLLASSSSSTPAPAVARLWLDDTALQLSSTVLGCGATGQVVEGSYEGRPVAVRVVDLADASAAARQALRQETCALLEVWGECRHACQVKGAVIRHNKLCLVMKRYSTSLDHIIAEAAAEAAAAAGPSSRTALPLPRMLRYTAQILAGLHELHSLGVVMGDVRPQQLLLDGGTLDELVLGDLGRSSIKGRAARGSSVCPASPAALQYMSPEVLAPLLDQPAPAAPVTAAADMWSLACTVLHMATGAAPHGDLSAAGVGRLLRRVGLHRQAPAIPDCLPGPLRQLLGRCLSADPPQRPTAMQALRELQQMVLQDEPLPHDGLAAAVPSSTTATLTAVAAGAAAAAPSSQAGAEQASDPVGLRELAQLMSSTDPEEQAAAAQGLAYLVLTKQADAATANQAGCLTGLVVLLHGSSSEVQEQAARTLATLAAADAAESPCFAVPGLLEGLVAALGSCQEGVQQQAARALASLSRSSAGAIAAQPGCLSSLVGALGSSSAEVQQCAAGALASLLSSSSSPSQAAVAAVVLGGECLGRLLAMLGSSSVGVRQQAAGAVAAALAGGGGGGVDGVLSRDVLAAVFGHEEELVALLHCEGAQAHAVRVLAVLVISSPLYAAALFARPGCLTSIAARLHSSDQHTCHEAVKALASMSAHFEEEDDADAVATPSCIQALADLCTSSSSSSSSMPEHAVVVLNRLADCSDAACDLMVDCDACLRGLLEQLRPGGSLQAQAAAVRTLLQLVQREDALGAIALVPGCVDGLRLVLDSSSIDADVLERAVCLAAYLTPYVAASPRRDSGAEADEMERLVSLDRVVELLSSSDEIVQQHAAYALGNLAEGDGDFDFGCRAARLVAVPGCLEGLVRCLSSSSVNVREAAATVLGDLAGSDEALGCKEAIAAVPGSLQRLLELCGSESEGVQAAAARALSKLTRHCRSNQAALFGLWGCMHSLVSCLASSCDEAVEHAANVIGCLVQDDAARVLLAVSHPGCLTALVGALSSDSEDVQYAAAEALADLASSQDAADSKAAIAGAPGCIARLVELLGGGSANVQSQALIVLYRLARDCPSNQLVITCQPGCISSLVACLESSDGTVLWWALAALVELSGHAATGSDVVSAAGPRGLSLLVALLGRTEGPQTDSLPARAAEVLASLAGSSSANQAAIAAVPGIMPALVEVLQGSCIYGQAEAARALANLTVGNAANRAAVAAVPGCLDRLSALLADGDTPGFVRRDVARALQLLQHAGGP